MAADQELLLKKRARRRLVGAIALVLLMLIVLPFLIEDRAQNNKAQAVNIVMSGEALDDVAKEAASEVTTALPQPQQPASAGFDSNVVPSNSPIDTAPAQPVTTSADASTTKPDEVEMPVATPLPAKPEAANLVEKDSSKQSVKAESKPEQKAEAKPVEVEKKEAPSSNNQHKFYVQVGVFSDAANVKRLQTKLAELGYKTQTEKVATPKGEKTRLKTQVFAERNEAAIALENIKSAGLTGMVVSQ